MFTLFQQARFVSRKIAYTNYITYYCFSAGSVQYLKKVKMFEKLKTGGAFPKQVYEFGKYIIFLKGDKVFIKANNDLVTLGYRGINFFKKQNSKIVLLNVLSHSISGNDVCLFAVNIEEANENDIKKLENEIRGRFVEVRHSLFFLAHDDAQNVIQSRGLLHFDKVYNYCNFCGGKLKAKEGGYQKLCGKCNQIHYPNLAPIALTLVEDISHEEVLLVRQQRHPPGMYTCVAGFIEPGESFEEAVKREVAEEVGLEICNIEYVSSQHWAMPSCQLTLGCLATACDKNILIDHNELIEAKWTSHADLKEAVLRVLELKDLSEITASKLWVPHRNAISHHVMVAWLRKYHDYEPLSGTMD